MQNVEAAWGKGCRMNAASSSDFGGRPHHAAEGMLRCSATAEAPLDFTELRHELRNALMTASGYAQRLQQRSETWADEDDRRALDALRDSLRHACHLLKDDEGSQPVRSLEPRQIVAEAFPQVPVSRITDVVTRIGTEQPLVGCWNHDRIVQILANLLGKAGKYLQPGTPIVIEITCEADQARITIQDCGIGIDAEDLDTIFGGHRTETAGIVAEDSGLGLQIRRRLVQAEGRQMGATSQPGVGSSFWGTLPLRPQNAPRIRSEDGEELAKLSRRQQEVAACIAEGLTNRQIAQRLVVAQGTVANHLETIRRRLGLRNRTQIGVWAVEHGLFRSESEDNR